MRDLHFMSALAVLVGVAGALLLAYGVGRVYPPAGFMVVGLLCLLWSWLVSKMMGYKQDNTDKGD